MYTERYINIQEETHGVKYREKQHKVTYIERIRQNDKLGKIYERSSKQRHTLKNIHRRI